MKEKKKKRKKEEEGKEDVEKKMARGEGSRENNYIQMTH